MVGKKWYYIVCNDGQIEVVHPLQIEKDDNILFKCFSEICCDYGLRKECMPL